MMKKTVLFAMGLVAVATTHAQNTIESTVSADVVSKYVWRGLELGDVAVQPTLGVGYKGLSLTAWGSYGLSNKDDVKEFDLTLGYTIGGLNIGTTGSQRDSTPTHVTSSSMPTAPTICSKPTSVTTSVPWPCSGTPTSPATTEPTKAASGPTAATWRPASPSASPR